MQEIIPTGMQNQQITLQDARPQQPVEVIKRNVFKFPRKKTEELKISDVEKLTDNLNKIMEAFDIQAKFSVHEKTKDIMIRIMNVKTNELIREIPSKKILDIVGKMMEMIGLLLDEKA